MFNEILCFIISTYFCLIFFINFFQKIKLSMNLFFKKSHISSDLFYGRILFNRLNTWIHPFENSINNLIVLRRRFYFVELRRLHFFIFIIVVNDLLHIRYFMCFYQYFVALEVLSVIVIIPIFDKLFLFAIFLYKKFINIFFLIFI